MKRPSILRKRIVSDATEGCAWASVLVVLCLLGLLKRCNWESFVALKVYEIGHGNFFITDMR